MPKADVTKRYFAYVGSELIELDEKAKDGPLQTSAPVRFYRVRATVNDMPLTADGDTLADAEKQVDAQIKAATK